MEKLNFVAKKSFKIPFIFTNSHIIKIPFKSWPVRHCIHPLNKRYNRISIKNVSFFFSGLKVQLFDLKDKIRIQKKTWKFSDIKKEQEWEDLFIE